MARVRRVVLVAVAAASLCAAGAGGDVRPATAPLVREPPQSPAASFAARGPGDPSAEDEGDSTVRTVSLPLPSVSALLRGELGTTHAARRDASPSAAPPPPRRAPGALQVRRTMTPARPSPSAAAPVPADRARAAVTPVPQPTEGAASGALSAPPIAGSEQESTHPARASPSASPKTASGSQESPLSGPDGGQAVGSGPRTPVATSGPEESASALLPQTGARASDAAPRPSRLTPPHVISAPGMDYPGEAFHLTLRWQDLGSDLSVGGAEGTVALRALVLADGTVHEIEVVVSSGSEVLDRTAADAVARWRFAPAARDGVPIDAYVTLRIRYVVR